jgi:hypothetical protein
MTTTAAASRNRRGKLIVVLPTILEDGDHQSTSVGINGLSTTMISGSGTPTCYSDDPEDHLVEHGYDFNEEQQDGVTRSSSSWNLFLGFTATVYLGLLVCIVSISANERFGGMQYHGAFGKTISPISTFGAEQDTSTFTIRSSSYDPFETDIESYAGTGSSLGITTSSISSNDSLPFNHSAEPLSLRAQDGGFRSDILNDEDNDPEHLTIYDTDEDYDNYNEQPNGREPEISTFYSYYS